MCMSYSDPNAARAEQQNAVSQQAAIDQATWKAGGMVGPPPGRDRAASQAIIANFQTSKKAANTTAGRIATADALYGAAMGGTGYTNSRAGIHSSMDATRATVRGILGKAAPGNGGNPSRTGTPRAGGGAH